MQLTDSSHDIVAATASTVAAHAEEIARRFYADMFEARPDLLNVFNRANQANGEQQKTLAASIVAFGTWLVSSDEPDFSPVMSRIAHKHVSLGIRGRDYLVVQRYLLAAIGKGLGEAVTPAVAAAWDEVYWLFATALIAEEARLYALSGADPEEPWQPYRVTGRVDETDDVFSLLLAPVDGTVPAYEPGQYISIAVDLPDGVRQPRQYTLSSAPGSDALRITVKRVRAEDGRPAGQVSSFLHEHAVPGAVFDVTKPAGDVTLAPGSGPLVLVSAGIGITPVAAYVDELARRQPERPVRVLHADRTQEEHPLRDEIAERLAGMADASSRAWYAQGADGRGGRLDLSEVDLTPDATVFMCGSLPFMQQVRHAAIAQGIAPEAIRYEVFGPDMWIQRPAA